MKWLLVTVALLVTVVGGAYWNLPWVLQTVIVQQAAARGIAVSDLQIQRPQWGSVVVDRAALSIGANAVQLEAAVVEYTWDSLLAGRATDVSLAAMSITARSDTAVPAQPVAVGELIGTLPALLATAWQVVPADSFAVGELRVGIAAAEFAGAMKYSAAAASLRGRVSGPEPIPTLLLDAQLEPGGALRAEIRESDVAGNRFELQADLVKATGTLAGSWSLLLDSDGAVLAAQAHGSVPFTLSQDGWVVQSGAVVAVQMEPWSATFDVTGAEGAWHASADEFARVTADWRAALQPAPIGISAEGGLAATLGSAAVQVELQSGTVVNTTRVAGEDWSIGSARMELVEAVSMHIALAPLEYRLQSATRLALQLDGVVWSDYQLSPFVDLTVQELSGDAATFATSTEVRVPVLQLSGSARVTGSPGGDLRAVEFSAEQNLAKPFFANLWPRGKRVYDLDAGGIRAHGALRVDDAGSGGLTGRMTLTLADLGAHYEAVTFTGVNGELDVGLQSDEWQLGPSVVRIGVTDMGFPVTDLSASVTLTPARATMSGVRGRAFGGEVSVAGLEYDLARGASEFLLEAQGIELSQVLALEGETITGRGTLDGQVPVKIADNEVRVSKGRFSTRPPGGVLSYGGAEEAAAALNQPGVGFAIAALADFSYGVLDVGVNYEPNGDLLLGIHLEGHNPRFESGRPIHYNLNISENIPVLLQSLQLSDEVGKRVEKRLER